MTLGLALIPAAPLMVSILLLGSRRFGARAGGWVSLTGVAVSLFCLAYLSADIPLAARTGWIISGGLSLEIGLRLDALSRFMGLLVAIVSLCVFLYAIGYMAAEKDRRRFFAQFSFFSGAMLALVLADTWIVLFAAWEWVGLASYLLIGFHYREAQARSAARKAILITRLGDMGFLLAWLWAWTASGSSDLQVFLHKVQAGDLASSSLTAIALLLLIAALGKSAQLPLSAWLPAAMIGPTPVSALIHSATMVAAGIYLVLRLYPLFEAVPAIMTLMLWLGAASALFAALAAMRQQDLKRVLAWSTISQLGEMIMALGLAAPLAAAFHLTTHAAFKSTLFLAAGAVDRGVGTRDLNKLGGLMGQLPLTAAIFGLAALSLAGIPFFSGYYSEEHILAAAAGHSWLSAVIMVLLVFCAGIYISRAWAVTFIAWPHSAAPKAQSAGVLMHSAMLLLTLAAIGSGFAMADIISNLLPFGAGPEIPGAWKIAAIAAAFGGLAVGYLQVRRQGARPYLGLAGALETGLDRLTMLPAQAMSRMADFTNRIETALDRLAGHVAGGAARTAFGCNFIERHIDRLALFTERGVFQFALKSDAIEIRGFAAGTNRMAGSLAQLGKWAGALQTGKAYGYLLGLFVWVFIILICGVSIW